MWMRRALRAGATVHHVNLLLANYTLHQSNLSNALDQVHEDDFRLVGAIPRFAAEANMTSEAIHGLTAASRVYLARSVANRTFNGAQLGLPRSSLWKFAWRNRGAFRGGDLMSYFILLSALLLPASLARSLRAAFRMVRTS